MDKERGIYVDSRFGDSMRVSQDSWLSWGLFDTLDLCVTFGTDICVTIVIG